MSILVCRHMPYEGLGMIADCLTAEGISYQYVDFFHPNQGPPDMDDYEGLIILGGDMNADEVGKYPFLVWERTLIKKAMLQHKPVLGICLGAQVLARALLAAVYKNPVKEIGWYPLSMTGDYRNDPLFSHFQQEETVFQWHGDTFDLPEGAVRLASSPACKNQAFRYGDNVYALQFHLEITEEMIRQWFSEPLDMEEINYVGGEKGIKKILEEAPRYIKHLNELGEKTFRAFARLVRTSQRLQGSRNMTCNS